MGERVLEADVVPEGDCPQVSPTPCWRSAGHTGLVYLLQGTEAAHKTQRPKASEGESGEVENPQLKRKIKPPLGPKSWHTGQM